MDSYVREELEGLIPEAVLDEAIRRAEARAQAETDAYLARLNPGHYHEVLDRVHVIREHLEHHVGTHPVLLKHADLTEIYERAQDLLGKLYQSVGAMAESWPVAPQSAPDGAGRSAGAAA
jgi:hypothetical protein